MVSKISNGMNKYIIGGIIVLVVLIFTSYNLPNGFWGTNTSKVSSAIVVYEPPYDFGDIDIFGGKVHTTYTLINEGLEDVTILSAQTSCMCTEGEIDSIRFGMHDNRGMSVVIPAGGEKTLTATYDPLAHGPSGTGKVTRELTLTTNSSETPEIQVKFTANVVKNED